ncbi:hypothetical protein K9U34_02605 [Lawsonia intracellularis]|uniref:hypothetical protein n=1 Tax=Lawsonia intracellularis TaxID=29546 RepID=UPI00030DB118|nr:hypothetical protein [Lawsonia intracellularis]KAA0204988.1 hypothetical protein C4K43_00555 [Lawsonia intracellularis]MBZ3892489.1 hypothetical protein [Lawsonia intracellularis]OMQ06130.1 hypothetical protein BW722_00385 [Lawsonia intracellularis]RBN32463.1 hypothetical protein DR194_05820 [Lawsonia intracellularis]UYH52998.1 hypothetical protein OCT60_00380 [Lawsonia intracellularis]
MNEFIQRNGFYGNSILENYSLQTETQADTHSNIASCALFWKKFKTTCQSTYNIVSFFLYETFIPSIYQSNKYIACYCAIQSSSIPMLQKDKQCRF